MNRADNIEPTRRFFLPPSLFLPWSAWQTAVLACMALLVFACAADGATRPSLLKMEKQDVAPATRVLVTVAGLPVYTVSHSGARIDLFFENCGVAAAFKTFAVSPVFSKNTLGQEEGKVRLTFYAAREIDKINHYFFIEETNKIPPASDSTSNPGIRLVLDIQWRSPQKSQPRMVSTQQSPLIAAAFPRSPFEKNWADFFTGYEATPPVTPVIHYTLLPFPVASLMIAGEELEFSGEIISMGRAGNYETALNLVDRLDFSVLSEKQRAIARLLRAEIICRDARMASEPLDGMSNNATSGAFAPLYAYLEILRHVVRNSPYAAQYILEQHKAALLGIPQFQTPLGILAAELLLATDRPKEAIQLLESMGTNDSPSQIRDLRLADAYFALSSYDRARDLYRKIFDTDPTLFETHPRSQAGRAFLLYSDKEYARAADGFRLLQNMVTDRDIQAMAMYWEAAALLKNGQKESALTIINTVMGRFSDTEGGERARMKRNDLRAPVALDPAGHSDATLATLFGEPDDSLRKDSLFFQQSLQNLVKEIRDEYAILATSSSFRSIREEAWFKQALFTFLSDDPVGSAKLLNNFFRNFRFGKMQNHALTLQSITVPKVIDLLSKENEYIKAIALAEQNRDILLGGAKPLDYLPELAASFESIGLYDRAVRVYQYLLRYGEDEHKTAEYFLPFARASLRAGDMETLTRLYETYRERFPQGKDRWSILAELLQGLEEKNDYDQALAILETVEMNALEPQFFPVVSRVFWEKEKFDAIIDLVEGTSQKTRRQLPDDAALLYAEALLKKNRLTAAAKEFERLRTIETLQDQALFRLAQIKLEKGAKNQAVNIFKQIAEKGRSPYWKKLAAENIILLQEKIL